jgi:hypothetical protein
MSRIFFSCISIKTSVLFLWIISISIIKLSFAEATRNAPQGGINNIAKQLKNLGILENNRNQPKIPLSFQDGKDSSIAEASKWNFQRLIHSFNRQISNASLPFSLTALHQCHHNHNQYKASSTVYQRLNPLWKQKPLLAPAAAAAAGLSFSIISILRATPAHAYSENKHSKKMKPQEVITRTLTFWKRAAPIILHYKFTQTWLNLHHSNSNRCITNNNNDENAYATKFNWPSFPSLFQYYDQQKRDKIYEELHERYAPEALDIVLQMRGLFIKIGQVLSSRPDFIPEAYVNIMQTVQDDVPAWDASEIFDIIDKSWRRNFNLGVYDLLQEFDPEVLGSASIGQVHLGKLRKDVRKRMNLGKERELVAIKVMHLDAEDRFRNDFKIFKWLCRLALPGWTPILRELESQMMTEFDYIHEADNLEIVRKNMMASPYRNKVVVPQPLLEYCTPNVLIMEYLDGVKLESAILSDLTSALRGDEGLAKSIMEEKRRGM